MYIKQISVFIENTPGRLAEFTHLLGKEQIDLISLSIADTTSFGILRGLVADYERAVRIIANAGYTVRVTDVLAASVLDEPGGLAKVLAILSENGVSVEYLYSFIRNAGHNALIILRVEEIDKAAALLEAHGVKTLSQDEVSAL